MKLEFLLIDDDEITIMLSEILLEDFPRIYPDKNLFRWRICIRLFKECSTAKATRYIISLDINMPLMNGWQFLEAIKIIRIC